MNRKFLFSAAALLLAVSDSFLGSGAGRSLNIQEKMCKLSRREW